MAFKRKPPKGSVRRVKTNGKNNRAILVNQMNESIQVESDLENINALMLIRDPRNKNVRTQARQIHFIGEDNKEHSYVPDFEVHKWDNTIDIEEVTTSKRRLRPNIRVREKGAIDYFSKEGKNYLVKTEFDLPSKTEEVNILALRCYRARIYANEKVTNYVQKYLSCTEKMNLLEFATTISKSLDIPRPIVFNALFHLIWNNFINIDPEVLVIVDGDPNPKIMVWKSKDGKK